ncbi:MAG: hypothetical protein MUO50_01460 [Longimicrobiales bacterium]|nr:hypothetical protein [Longimicrobiales bacterium]
MESHKPSLEERLDPFPEEGDDRIHAAVSVILRVGEELEILLIKRARRRETPGLGRWPSRVVAGTPRT